MQHNISEYLTTASVCIISDIIFELHEAELKMAFTLILRTIYDEKSYEILVLLHLINNNNSRKKEI